MQCNCRVYSCLHLQQGCWLQKETSYHPLCLCQILLHVQCKVLDPSNKSCIRDCQISDGIVMDSAIFSVIAQRKIRCHHLRLLLRRLFHFGIWIRKLLFHNRFDSRMDIHFLSWKTGLWIKVKHLFLHHIRVLKIIRIMWTFRNWKLVRPPKNPHIVNQITLIVAKEVSCPHSSCKTLYSLLKLKTLNFEKNVYLHQAITKETHK